MDRLLTVNPNTHDVYLVAAEYEPLNKKQPLKNIQKLYSEA